MGSVLLFGKKYMPRLMALPPADMHKEWDEIAFEAEDGSPNWVIKAHRESAKTTFWEIIYPTYRLCLWLWLRAQGVPREDERLALLGATDDAAEASLRQVRFELESNAAIKKDFNPQMGRPWNDGAISLKGAGDVKNPTAQASSLTAFKPGARLTCVVAGDVVQPRHVYSKLQRDKDQHALEEVVRPMVMENGVVILNGTTYHADDLLGRLGKDSQYKTKVYPLVINEESKRVSWPERFSWARVMELKKKPIVFSRQYQLVEMASEDRLIPWPKTFDNRRLERRDSVWRIDGEICRVIAGIDLAYTEREVNKGSRTAIITGLLKSSSKEIYIVDVRAVHYGPEKVKPMMNDVWKQWGHEAIYVEEVGLQKVFRLLFKSEGSVIPLIASQAQGDKIQRITGTLSEHMVADRVFIINEGVTQESHPEELVRELSEFPGDQVDTADALEHLLRNVYTSPRFMAGPRADSVVRNVRRQALRQNWIRTGISGGR